MYTAKNVVRGTLVGVVALITTTSAGALGNTYFGVDLQQRELSLVRGFGDSLFAKRIPQANAYLGLRVNEHLSFEVGHQFNQANTRTLASDFDTVLLGVQLPNNEFYVTENKFKFNATHINVVGRFPVSTKATALGSLGLMSFSVNSRIRYIGDENSIFIPEDVFSEHYRSRKLVPQLGFGFEYACNEDLQLRFAASYQWLSTFKNIVPKEQSSTRMSFKDSMVFGIGLQHNF